MELWAASSVIPHTTAVLQVALFSRGRWSVLRPGSGDPPDLPHRWNRTVLVGSAFVAQTFAPHLRVSGALCSAPKIEATLGKVAMEAGKVDSFQ